MFFVRENRRNELVERGHRLPLSSFIGNFTKLPVEKIGTSPNLHILRKPRRTQHSTCRENTMNHGGRRRTTTTMVPHPRLRGVETLTTWLCNNATSLKLEHIIINIT